jgi:hypothetical protein
MRRSTAARALLFSLVAPLFGCAEITGIEPGQPYPPDAGNGGGTTTSTGTGNPSSDVDVPCVDDDGCQHDMHCVGGLCKPWDASGSDPSCVHVAPTGVLAPALKCSFEQAPPGDPQPDHLNVQAIPLVTNFHGEGGTPSIVALFAAPNVDKNYVTARGVLRILRGDDCTVEPLSDADPSKLAVFGGTDLDGDGEIDWFISTTSSAVGDLDGDGVPEIVVNGSDGSIYAFTRKNGAWSMMWKTKPVPGMLAPNCPGDNCSGLVTTLAIHDLDGDGVPEVLREDSVLAHNGVILTVNAPGYIQSGVNNTLYMLNGLPPVAGHLLGDPATVQLTDGASMWTWDVGTKAWQTYPGFKIPVPASGILPVGPSAVADFGAYGKGLPASAPEIAVAQSNTLAVYALNGEIVIPPTTVIAPDNTEPNWAGGGPPVIADFDGDGLPEVAISLKTRKNAEPQWNEAWLAVFDPDCGPDPRPGGACLRGTCEHLGTNVPCPNDGYLLWTRQTRDTSGFVFTGVSAFDFEGDGKREILFADQCFSRVYDGSGNVISSVARASPTGYESPIVADADGDFRADLIIVSAQPAYDDTCDQGLEGGVDASFPGARCEFDHDCLSGSCVKGLCRCQASAECCVEKDDAKCESQGYKCAPQPAGTPGDGNTCRASRPTAWSGLRVYGDAHDNWIRARRIYNQHAYSITNVNEDGTIPSTTAWQSSWLVPGVDSFRESAMGTDVDPRGTFDATTADGAFTCDANGAVSLQTKVCNRGASPLPKGLAVGFYVDTKRVCSAATTKALAPGECDANLACTWSDPPATPPDNANVDVIANDGARYAECKEGNNRGRIAGVWCAKKGGK